MRVISFDTKTTPQQALRFAEREVHIRAHGSDVYDWGRPRTPEDSFVSRTIRGTTDYSDRTLEVTLEGSGRRASQDAPNCWESANVRADFGEGSRQFALNVLDTLLLEGVFPEQLTSTWGKCERGMDSWNSLAYEVVQFACWTNADLARHMGKIAGIPAEIVDHAVDAWIDDNPDAWEQVLMGPLSEQQPKTPAQSAEGPDEEFVEDMLLSLIEEDEGQ